MIYVKNKNISNIGQQRLVAIQPSQSPYILSVIISHFLLLLPPCFPNAFSAESASFESKWRRGSAPQHTWYGEIRVKDVDCCRLTRVTMLSSSCCVDVLVHLSFPDGVPYTTPLVANGKQFHFYVHILLFENPPYGRKNSRPQDEVKMVQNIKHPLLYHFLVQYIMSCSKQYKCKRGKWEGVYWWLKEKLI